MPRYVNGNKTNRDLIAVCDEALRQKRVGNIPVVNGVRFEHAFGLGWCQQHVREAVEACAHGYEGGWDGASCCATSTCQHLRRLGYEQIGGFSAAQPGDLVYWSPCGSRCGTCGQDAGHTGVLHHRVGDTWSVWQNTTSERRALCCIPLAPWQHHPVGIFRVFPLAGQNSQATPPGERPVNWHGTYLDPQAVLFQDGKHYVELRAAATAEGSVVHVDPKTNKVFVGPKAWWPE